jgi:hypothetical protein
VRRPADVETRWGEYRLEKTDTSYVYADSLLRVTLVPNRGQFAFVLENRTEHSLQIVWDEMAYVGPTGVSSRVSPGETRVIDMEKAHPPTTVPAMASVFKVAIPNDLLHTGSYGHWIEDFVTPATAAAAEGKEMRLLMPIRVRDVVNEYTFVFQLNSVTVTSP